MENEIFRQTFTGSLPSENLPALFEDCVFERCDFKDLKLTYSKFIDCKFLSCDLSNLNLSNVRMRDCSFDNCKLLGVQWIQMEDLANFSFKNSNLSYANFTGMKLKKEKFLDCLLKDADFADCDLTEAELTGCDLGNARFLNTNLSKADFRRAKNYSIDPLQNKIKGAKFSSDEVYGLLLSLGIVIED